jgi:hypothetical protein
MKRCSRCGRTKALQHFVRVRHPRNPGAWMYKHCRACDRERQLAYRVAIQADPVRRADRNAKTTVKNRRLRAANPERYAAYQAAYRERLKSRPENHALFLIDRRFRREGRINMAPAVDGYEPPSSGAHGHSNHTGPMLDVAPMRDWLAYEFQSWDCKDVARRCGVNEATVRRILSGQQRTVSLHIADRMFVNADCPHLLALLYPVEVAA